MTICYLRIANETLDDAERCPSIEYAVGEYRAYVEELDRFGMGEPACGSIHIPDNDTATRILRPEERDRLNEYPDYVLTVGPKGGVRKERA